MLKYNCGNFFSLQILISKWFHYNIWNKIILSQIWKPTIMKLSRREKPLSFVELYNGVYRKRYSCHFVLFWAWYRWRWSCKFSFRTLVSTIYIPEYVCVLTHCVEEGMILLLTDWLTDWLFYLFSNKKRYNPNNPQSYLFLEKSTGIVWRYWVLTLEFTIGGLEIGLTIVKSNW